VWFSNLVLILIEFERRLSKAVSPLAYERKSFQSRIAEGSLLPDKKIRFLIDPIAQFRCCLTYIVDWLIHFRLQGSQLASACFMSETGPAAFKLSRMWENLSVGRLILVRTIYAMRERCLE